MKIMVRPRIFIPEHDLKGLIPLVKKGWNNEQIAQYYRENGIECSRMAISRRVQDLKDKGLL